MKSVLAYFTVACAIIFYAYCEVELLDNEVKELLTEETEDNADVEDLFATTLEEEIDENPKFYGGVDFWIKKENLTKVTRYRNFNENSDVDKKEEIENIKNIETRNRRNKKVNQTSKIKNKSGKNNENTCRKYDKEHIVEKKERKNNQQEKYNKKQCNNIKYGHKCSKKYKNKYKKKENECKNKKKRYESKEKQRNMVKQQEKCCCERNKKHYKYKYSIEKQEKKIHSDQITSNRHEKPDIKTSTYSRTEKEFDINKNQAPTRNYIKEMACKVYDATINSGKENPEYEHIVCNEVKHFNESFLPFDSRTEKEFDINKNQPPTRNYIKKMACKVYDETINIGKENAEYEHIVCNEVKHFNESFLAFDSRTEKECDINKNQPPTRNYIKEMAYKVYDETINSEKEFAEYEHIVCNEVKHFNDSFIPFGSRMFSCQ